MMVLPPRSRYVPAGMVGGAWEEADDELTPAQPRNPPDSDMDPAAAAAAATYLAPPQRVTQTKLSQPKATRPGGPQDGTALVVYPQPARPASARTRPSEARSLFSPDVRATRKGPVTARPGSAPDKGAGMTDGRLRSEVFALRTPGEQTLPAPQLTPRSPAARQANHQLQFELGLTATVLRAAQTRLAQEREQRQIARIGEERALDAMKRARDEALITANEKVSEELNLAKTMAEQRRDLENELTRLENEQDVRTSEMQREINIKEDALRAALEKIARLEAALEASEMKLATATDTAEQLRDQRQAEATAFKEERREYVERVRTLEEQLREEQEARAREVEKEKSLRLMEVGKAADSAQSEAERLLEEEREKRVQHLGQVGLKRMLNQKLAAGWTAWTEVHQEKQRQLRKLKAAGSRLLRPRLVASYQHWQKSWKSDEAKKASMTVAERLAEAEGKQKSLAEALERTQAQLAEARGLLTTTTDEEAERIRLADEKAAAEKEKRVEHQCQMAIKRLGKRDLSKGWETWEAVYYEHTRRKRLLQAASAKLTKPHLTASYAHWKKDWELEARAMASMSQAERLTAETARRQAAESELHEVRAELAKLRDDALNGFGQEAEIQRRMREKEEQEKQKRVESLHQRAARRIGNQEIMRGWSAWQEQYLEKRRNLRLLKQAGQKLARPKLVACYSLWRTDWKVEQQIVAKKSSKERLADEKALNLKLQAELDRVKEELGLARKAALNGTALEDERRRQMEEQLASDKEKRVEHLTQMAVRRLGKKGIAMAYESWAEMYYEQVRRKRLLVAAGSKLAKPKLSAGYSHWKADWELEMKSQAAMSVSDRLASEQAKHDVTLAELAKVREELAKAREAALNGTALEDERRRQMEEQAEKDKEKRVEHLGQMAARRMGKKELSMGFESWAEQYYEVARNKRLLAAAGAKLAKPKMSAGYLHWKRDWEIDLARYKTKSQKEIFLEDKRSLEAEVSKLRIELEKLRKSALDGTAREEELARQREEQSAYEKEKRVEHLGQMAARRMGKKEISQGFETWATQYYEVARNKRLLLAAGAKLAKPKLSAGYSLWKHDWQATEAAKGMLTVEEQLAAERKRNAENDVELAKLRAEMAKARESALNGTAREEELARQREEQSAYEKEKRVEHLSQMAARRMGKKEISQGFETWAEMYYEKQRQKRLLSAAGSRLAKPKLSAGYEQWKRDWQVEMSVNAKMSHKQRLELEKTRLANAEATISKLQTELSKAREAALNGTALEDERRRQREEQDAHEKEKRVEHLGQMAARRMGKKEISQGFETWATQYYEVARNKRLLAAAGAKLAKPKLSAGYLHWKRDWELEEKTAASMTIQQRLDAEKARIVEKDTELAKLRDELAKAREAALNGTALEDERRRQMEEQAEKDKEKRVEHLGQMAARRMGKKELSMGFETWATQYYEVARNKRLLAAAGAKLAKPKLAAGYAHWRIDWEIDLKAQARLTDKQKLTNALKRADAAEADLHKAKEALDALKDAAMNGNAREEALRLQAEQDAAADKEKRVEHLTQMAVRRLGKKGIAMAFETWADEYYEQQRQKRLLLAAGARLAKPKLMAGYSHWKVDWQMEMRINSKMSAAEKLASEKKKLEDALADAAKLRVELAKARQAALNGTAKEDEMRRQMEEQAAMDKEKRVQHLTQMAVRRMGKKEISRGFEAWAELYLAEQRNKRLLLAAGARLAKPKLMAGYSHWKGDWQADATEAAAKTQAQLLAEQTGEAAEHRKKVSAMEQELVKLRMELARAREAALNGTALEDERRRQREEQDAYDKEKRVEHLTQMAVRRLGKKGIAMAWESWMDSYYETVRYKRLLTAAGSKLAKPKLSAGYSHWRRDWELEQQQQKGMTVKQRFEREQAALAAANAKLAKVEAELAKAREAALNGTALADERRRQAEEEAEKEKEKRVEHLSQMAARRLGKKGIAMAWETWADMYYTNERNKRLLQAAGAKLAKPKLSGGYLHWKADWELELKSNAKMTATERINAMAAKLQTAEADLAQTRVELNRAREAALNGTALEDERRRQAEEKSEIAKQQRVEHLGQMAARRMGKKELSMGFETWATAYYEAQRNKRLLLAAGSRLAKPKLSACYSHWRTDWDAENERLKNMNQAELLAIEGLKVEEQRKKYMESEAELSKVRMELKKLRDAVANGEGLEAEAQRKREEQAANEKEKRVEHLTQMAVRRMGKKGIAMAYETWADMYYEQVRRKRLLQAAGSKLAKPKLSGGYMHWKFDWEHDMKMQAKMSVRERLDQKEKELQTANAELSRLRLEFERARQAALNGTAKEDELRRQMEEQAAMDKEKRVEHITQMAVRRMGKKEISRGFETWAAAYYEQQRNKRLLAAAGARLAKPKLSAGYSHWKADWEAEVVALKSMTQSERLAVENSRREAAEADARKAREEMNRKLATAQRERDELLNKLSELDGGAAARELEMQRQLEEEKEKRVAHLQRMAARRILQKDLSRGFSAWADMWESKRRNERLLRAASARLSKPKLAACYTQWRADWAIEEAKKKVNEKAAKVRDATGSETNAQLKAMQAELAAAKDAAARAGGSEEEYKKFVEEEAAREKEKRVEHLSQMAARRMGKKELSMGFETWAEMYYEMTRNKRLLMAAGSRLAKPKLSAGYVQWKNDWQAEMIAASKMSVVEKYKAEKTKADKYMKELERTQAELSRAREAALNGTAKEDEMRRQMEEQAAMDKQQRVEHITQMAVKRMGKKEISRGWETWAEQYLAQARNKRLLLQASTRLTKPRLAAMYAHWRQDWTTEVVNLAKMTQKQRLRHAQAKAEAADAEARTFKLEMQKKLEMTTQERDELLQKLTALDGGAAAMELELKRQLEQEKEKRIAHLQRMAARRILQKDLSRGFSAWADMWYTKSRQQRLLRAASARLSKPKMASSYAHWRMDFKNSRVNLTSKAMGSAEQKAAALLARNNQVEAELNRVKVELAKARETMAHGQGRDEELTKAQLARAAAEKEQRVEHLTQMAVRRIGKQAIARGWNAWAEQYYTLQRRKRLLAGAASRLAKPKLVHAVLHWKKDWEIDHVMKFKMTHKQRYEMEKQKRESTEGELYKVSTEGEQKQAELNKALADARAASLEHLRQLKEALRQVAFERDAMNTMRVRADEALDSERSAKAAEDLMRQQLHDANTEAERRLAQLLADQRRQLELEAMQIRTELETQLAALRQRLVAEQLKVKTAPAKSMPEPSAPRPSAAPSKEPSPLKGDSKGLRSVFLEYDPNKTVADQLREGLKKSNTRVLDLFREFDSSQDGKISKKEFREAFAIMGPDFPAHVVDETFDLFDPDKSGEIEFAELDKFLRRASGAPQPPAPKGGLSGPGGKRNSLQTGGKLAAAGAAAKMLSKKGSPTKPAVAPPPPVDVDPTDTEGQGKGEFTSNMRIRADDFFNADNDGNTELDFDEFTKMISQRRAADGVAPPTAKELKDLFFRLDLDDSGTVDLSEYVQYALREALRESKGRVLDLFREWDKDKSGFIDKEEFALAMNGMGFKCTKTDVAKIFKDLDPDGTNKLDYRELNQSLRKSLKKVGASQSGSRPGSGRRGGPATH